jgi:hypothetical protein
MRKSARILIASLLIAVFGVFTVGLPIVRYLCPMMNDDAFSCPCSPQSKSLGTAFANEAPPCCASYIVAERNTTPYTSVEKYTSHPLQAQSLAPLDGVFGFSSVSVVSTSSSSTASPPLPGEPLYILNNSFLI